MAAARPLIDHDEIRRWAEERSARPACVKGTGGRRGRTDIGMIRLDLPGFAGEESLQPISWQAWLRQFDENNLALMVQDETAGGQKSNFNKLVSRDTVQGRPPARARAAGRRTAARRTTARAAAGRKAKRPTGRKSGTPGATKGRTGGARTTRARGAQKTSQASTRAGAARKTAAARHSARGGRRTR
jgi:hypothetical protein